MIVSSKYFHMSKDLVESVSNVELMCEWLESVTTEYTDYCIRVSVKLPDKKERKDDSKF